MTRRPLALALSLLTITASSITLAGTARASEPCYTPAENYASGAGTPVDPYRLSTPAQLQRLAATPADWAASFTLTTSLAMTQPGATGTCIWTSGIGTTDTPYTGVFDGGGHSITGLNVNVESSTSPAVSGLFGVLGAAGEITQVTYTGNINVSGPGTVSAGSIVGHNYGALNTVASSGNVTATSSGSGASGQAYAGGIAGQHESSGTISGSTGASATTAAASGTAAAGGLYGTGSGTVSESSANGAATAHTASGEAHAGGIAGQAGGTITDSDAGTTTTATADAGSTEARAGGIAGTATAALTRVHSRGTTTTTGPIATAGGIAGRSSAGITSATATANTTATATSGQAAAGGIAGHSTGGTHTTNYATGNTNATTTGSTSDAAAGGLYGILNGTTVSRSYARGNTTASATGTAASAGITGASTGGSLSQVYATGTRSASGSGTARLGGILGTNSGTTAAASFWDATVAAYSAVGTGSPLTGTTGATTSAMKTLTTYSGAGWDIAAGYRSGVGIWALCTPVNDGYPILVVNQTSNECETLSPSTQTITGYTGSALTPTATLTATGFTGTVTYAITPALPAGLTMNTSTGVITGTPTATAATATHTITGTATGTEAESATATLTLTITAPSITPTTQTITAHRGTAITATTALTATGFTGTVTYAITPALPAGLTMNTSTGVITGTPTATAATATHTITGTAGSQSATATVTVTIDAQSITPATQTITGERGTAITATTALVATGFTGTVTYAITPALPAGLTMNTSTGVITGTPTATAATATHTITGTAGSQSATATVTVTITAGTPGTPGNVTATAADAAITVTWSAPTSTGSSPLMGYRATASPGGKTCTAPATATTCTITGLTNGTAYTVTVAAQNTQGWSAESTPTAAVTPGAVPAAPTEVRAQARINSARISWTPSTSTGVIDYTATATPGNSTCTVAANTATCLIENLTAGTAYTVTVTARNSIGNSAASTAATVTPAGEPGAVTSLSGQARNNGARLTWTAPENTGGTPLKGYQYRVNGGAWNNVPKPLANLTNLTPGTPAAIDVRARTEAGVGPAASVTVTPTAPASAARNVTARSSRGVVTVTWQAPTSLGGGTLKNYQYAAGRQDWKDTPGTRITLRGLPKGKPAVIRVRAVTSGGPGQIAAARVVVR